MALFFVIMISLFTFTYVCMWFYLRNLYSKVAGFHKILSYLALAVAALVSGPVYFFAAIYALVGGMNGECLTQNAEGLDLVYFSFTTFTTLGYGDIAPVGPCRLISSLEAVSGVISFGMTLAIIQMTVRELESKRRD